MSGTPPGRSYPRRSAPARAGSPPARALVGSVERTRSRHSHPNEYQSAMTRIASRSTVSGWSTSPTSGLSAPTENSVVMSVPAKSARSPQGRSGHGHVARRPRDLADQDAACHPHNLRAVAERGEWRGHRGWRVVQSGRRPRSDDGLGRAPPHDAACPSRCQGLGKVGW